MEEEMVRESLGKSLNESAKKYLPEKSAGNPKRGEMLKGTRGEFLKKSQKKSQKKSIKEFREETLNGSLKEE